MPARFSPLPKAPVGVSFSPSTVAPITTASGVWNESTRRRMARSFSFGEVDQPMQPIREPVRQVAWRQTFINLVGGDQSAERLVLEYMAEFIRKIRSRGDQRCEMLLCQFVRSDRRQRLQCHVRGIAGTKPHFAPSIACRDSHKPNLALT